MGSGKGAGKSNKDLKTLHLHQDKKSGHWVYDDSKDPKKKIERRTRGMDIVIGTLDTISFSGMRSVKNTLVASVVTGSIRGIMEADASSGVNQFTTTGYVTLLATAGVTALTYGIGYIRHHPQIKHEQSLLRKARETQHPEAFLAAAQNCHALPYLRYQAKQFALCATLLTSCLTFGLHKSHDKKADMKETQNTNILPQPSIRKNDPTATYVFGS